ncbi:hypothetical protein [Candidatus Stoquefichus massiliensis]|uniref:hypothetical protein n=1 Tax=Candidatus Stoquefichus massiliensis TaxID=1470350 RepID=UPI0004862DD4|nr:hypothetical protein [Candidatus Stoquefichus massiliensis]
MIQKKYLLLIGGLVWGIAGFNILRIGIETYAHYITILNILLSIIVYGLFQYFVFQKMVKKHTERIIGYEQEKQLFIKFFDMKAFGIMAFMMTFGIGARVLHVFPDIFIAVFYTGLGVSLCHAGLLFLRNYIRREVYRKVEEI